VANGPAQPDGDEAGAAVERAMVKMRRNMTKHSLGRMFTGVPGADTDLGQLFVVDAVDEGVETHGTEVSIGTIAELVGVDPPRASRLITAAAEAGLVSRTSSATDGRRTNVVLAPEGADLARRLRGFRQDFYGELMADWTEDERVEFARLLTRFTDALTARSRDRGQ
jgi:DNA-binding MarR family transcriptional regulator